MGAASPSGGEQPAVGRVFIPQLRVDVPPGWFVKESITIGDPDAPANIIASTEPLNPAINSQEYAERQGQVLQTEFRSYRELEFRPELVFGGRPGYIRTFRWITDEGESVHQIQISYVSAGLGLNATATTYSSRFDEVEPMLRRALAAITLETPPAD